MCKPSKTTTLEEILLILVFMVDFEAMVDTKMDVVATNVLPNAWAVAN